MKKWLKKHGRWVVVGLGVLFIGFYVYQISLPKSQLMLAFNLFGMVLWLPIIFFYSGAAAKLYRWWDKE